MKKIVAMMLCLVMMLSIVPLAQAEDKPITISILMNRHVESGKNEAEDLWFFKYLEHWLAEQGHNVQFELEQTLDPDQRVSLMLGTNNLPDLMWSLPIDNTEIVLYGPGEKMLLDWTPYLNKETMPNLMAQLELNPDAYAASICIDGAVYGLPYLTERNYPTATATAPNGMRLWINQEWLDQVNMEIPTTMDGFMEMLRAFKANIKIEGKEIYPVMENAGFLRKWLLSCYGFYGSNAFDGISPAVKNGQIAIPAYTEEYRAFVEQLHTMYVEGLISPDFFTLDGTTAKGYMADGVCGVIGEWTLGCVNDDFAKYVHVKPCSTEYCDYPVASLGPTFQANKMVASADTEHPELLALICDYLYSPEGAMMYYYGPMKGADPINATEGWFFNEETQLTTDSLVAGTDPDITNMTAYAKVYIYPHQYAGYAAHLALPEAHRISGVPREIRNYQVTDAVTGKVFDAPEAMVYTHDDNGGHWRLTVSEAYEKNSTTVYLPAVYMTEDDAQTAGDLKTVLKQHIATETAKFVVGTRSMDDYDNFVKELESMGIEEYRDLYVEAYAPFIKAMFGE